MVATWWKAVLFLLGGVAAAGGTAYVTGMLDPWLAGQAPIVASLSEDEAQPEATQEPDAPAAPAEEEPAAAGDQAGTDAAPTFDLVRIEPDGSLVIAGNAAPGSTIELLIGDDVIATAEAGEYGDFVAVLDEPLEPGDYEIVLRATAGGGEPVTSAQTALVSVPEREDGQVLAMVDEPGEPSRILTAPEPQASAEVEAGSEQDEAPGTDQQGASPERASEPVPAAGEDAGADSKEGRIAAASADDTTESEPQAAPTEDAGEAGQAAEPQPEIAAEGEADVPTEDDTGAAAQPPLPDDEPAEAQISVAAPSGEAAPVAASDEPDALTPFVVVEAVEIEGDTIYVAGSATPERTVRVYADTLLIGDAQASPAGRFLVEARRELPVGDYVIRADLLEADGSVLARAAVPFEREPGESIAAVAPSVPAVDTPAAPEQMAEVTDEAQDEPAGAAPAPAAEDASPEQPPAGTDVAAAPEPQSAQSAGSQDDGDAAAADASSGEAPQTMAAAEPDAAPEETAAAETDAPKSGRVGEESAAAEITQPKLERAEGSVIIRRGDTLWHISRRVYGRGIRYSTIYLANQDQIRNPDLIWPGQIFTLPGETAEGDAADLGAIGDQLLPEDEAAAETARQ